MQLHPMFITTLITEHGRTLRERAEKHRSKPRRERQARRAPWVP